MANQEQLDMLKREWRYGTSGREHADIGASLSDAGLRSADLSGTRLSGANIESSYYSVLRRVTAQGI